MERLSLLKRYVHFEAPHGAKANVEKSTSTLEARCHPNVNAATRGAPLILFSVLHHVFLSHLFL